MAQNLKVNQLKLWVLYLKGSFAENNILVFIYLPKSCVVLVQSSEYQLNWCLVVLIRYLNWFYFHKSCFLLLFCTTCKGISIKHVDIFLSRVAFILQMNSFFLAEMHHRWELTSPSNSLFCTKEPDISNTAVPLLYWWFNQDNQSCPYKPTVSHRTLSKQKWAGLPVLHYGNMGLTVRSYCPLPLWVWPFFCEPPNVWKWNTKFPLFFIFHLTYTCMALC